jgi:hypothetical protein
MFSDKLLGTSVTTAFDSACCFHSENLCEVLFIFITECEFDSTEVEGAASLQGRHQRGILAHRSVRSCLNPPKYRFRNCNARHCRYTSHCLLESSVNNDSKYEVIVSILKRNKTKPHIFTNTQYCWHLYITHSCS